MDFRRHKAEPTGGTKLSPPLHTVSVDVKWISVKFLGTYISEDLSLRDDIGIPLPLPLVLSFLPGALHDAYTYN